MRVLNGKNIAIMGLGLCTLLSACDLNTLQVDLPASNAANSGTTISATPAPTPTPTPAALLVANTFNSCATFPNGTMKCWGTDTSPDNLFSNQSTAFSIAIPGVVTSVGHGDYHSLLVINNKLYALGNQSNGELDGASLSSPGVSARTSVTAAQGGNYRSCVIDSGLVYCFGINQFEDLGGAPDAITPIAGLSHAVSLAGGGYHACEINDTGAMYCWGNDRYGQLDENPPGAWWLGTAPTLVPNIPPVITSSAGEMFTCAATVTTGQVYCWGDNSLDQLAGSSTHTAVTGLTGVTQLTSGVEFTCALTGGHVYCWGNNDYGQIGQGSAGGTYNTPQLVSGLSGVTSIAAGASHACAMINYGASVYCWGRNDRNQTGNVSTSDHSVTQVPGIP